MLKEVWLSYSRRIEELPIGFHVELRCGVAVEVGEEVAGETDISTL